MRVVAILASYNEELFIEPCLQHYISHGVEVYLIDNESTDRTVDIARTYLGRGLIGVETFPRHGVFALEPMLRRKEEIAAEIEADWFIHADPDEIRSPPPEFATLREAIEAADREGFNAINFRVFLFLPTVEHPEHEHTNYQQTMLWYRYMEPAYPNQIKAWKRPTGASGSKVSLAVTAGHKVMFDGLKLWPKDFILKHYQVLSLRHAVQKYVKKTFAPEELSRGWHGWRGLAEEARMRLPTEAEMRRFTTDAELDVSEPLSQTLIYRPQGA